MNTRSRQKRQQYSDPSGRTREISLSDVVKKIDFEDLSSNEKERNQHVNATQNDVMTFMAAIPEVNKQQNYRSFNEAPLAVALNTQSSKPITLAFKSNQNGTNLSYSLHENRCKNSSSSNVGNEKFVSAKEFFSKAETREILTSDYYSGSDTPSKLRESTRRLSLSKPLNNYIVYSSDEELDGWWEQPKTDYTYSASLSYRDRVTPDRRIGSPNMSRKGLRTGIVGTVMSPPYGHVDLPASAGDSLALRSREIPRGGLGTFSDESDVEESHTRRTLHKRNESVSLSRSTKGFRSHMSTTSSSNIISSGLDVDSDTEDETTLSQFARPIVRRGATSFLRSSIPSASTFDVSESAFVNSINGRANARMGNHIYTSTAATSRSSEALNGRRENRFNYDFKKLEESHSWKDKFSEWSFYSWTKIKDISIITSASLILWLTNVINAVRSRASQRKQRSRGLAVRKSDDVKKTTITTTTITSARRTIHAFTKNIFGWYKEKKKRNPCLWAWLPLLCLLLLLLLIPLLVYSFRERTNPREAASSVPLWIPLSSNESYNIVSNTFSWVHFWFSSISQNAVYLGKLFVNLTLYLLECIKWILFAVCDAFRLAFVWFFSFLSDHLPWSNRLPYSASSDGEVTGYSPLTMVSHGYSAVVENVKYVGNLSWLFIVNVATYAESGLLLVWNIIVWLSHSIQYVIASVFSSMGILLRQSCSYILSGILLVINFPSKLFMAIPFLTNTSKEAFPPPSSGVAPPVTFSPSQPPLHEFVEQILASPQLQSFVSLILQENLDRNEISKESLGSLIRLNVEAEMNKVRSEIVEHRQTSEGKFFASREEIRLLKKQQEKLLKQLSDMESTLKTFHHENIKESTESRERLQQALSTISLNMEKLYKQFEILQNDHDSLAIEMRSCCSNASLTFDQVESHVTLILSDLIGLSPKEDEESVLASRLGVWLKSYFVAKDEMEGKLSALWEKVHYNSQNGYLAIDVAHQETVKQTAELVMTVVLEQMRAEIKAQQEQMNRNLQQIDDVASSAIIKLNEISQTTQRNVQTYVDEKKADVHREVAKNIEKAVDGSIERKVPELMESRLSGQIDESLRIKLPNVLKSAVIETVENEMEGGLRHLVHEKVSQVLEENSLNAQLKISQIEKKESMRLEGLNVSDIERIVKAAFLKYDADKTGMVDHALESAGGSIISTRCTEGYQGHQAELTILGYSFYRYSTNTPRSIIQPDRNPGQCYAFKGSEGYIVIQFAGPVRVTAFTMEHIPKVLTPWGSIDSAPKDFSVYGLQTTEEEGFHFGDFVYDEDGEPLQYFPVQELSEKYFKYVELKIRSNHGNMQYTCLYRFRVHGVRQF